jgi:nicotinamide mononucleotide transporter
MTNDPQNLLQATTHLPFIGTVVWTSLLEWTSAAIGLLSVVGNLRLERWGWIAQALSSTGYLAVFYLQGLWGLAALQIYFSLVAVWAWWYWSDRSSDNSARITQLQPKTLLLVAFVWLVSTAMLGALLTTAGEISNAYLDAFVTIGSILAQALMVKHLRNTWHVWLIVDVVSIGLFAHSQLMATAVLYGVFAVLAMKGIASWKK